MAMESWGFPELPLPHDVSCFLAYASPLYYLPESCFFVKDVCFLLHVNTHTLNGHNEAWAISSTNTFVARKGAQLVE